VEADVGIYLGLEEVEEVGPTGTDINEVFIFLRNWIWQFGDCEVVGALDVLLDLDAPHCA